MPPSVRLISYRFQCAYLISALCYCDKILLASLFLAGMVRSFREYPFFVFIGHTI